MSKIEKYKQTKNVYEEVIKNITAGISKDKQADKARFNFSYLSGHKGHDSQAINLHCGVGYYGNSSYYGRNDEATTKHVIEAMNLMTKEIAQKAIELAERKIAEAKKDCEEEAQNILEELQNDKR